jgi:hypothetical protein
MTNFKTAVELALTRVKDLEVETRWSNATTPGTHSEPLPTDTDWAGGSLYEDLRRYTSEDSQETVWKRIEAIGGNNGYSTATWAWELRGLMDRLIGGVGLRRGRRDPNTLMEGEARVLVQGVGSPDTILVNPLDLQNLTAYAKRATGEKFLINPNKA